MSSTKPSRTNAVNATNGSPAGHRKNLEHSYSNSGQRSPSPELEKFPDLDSDTPAKPAEKHLKGELTLSDLQHNIATVVNERADSLENMITRNTVSIDALKKSIDFAFTEVSNLKSQMSTVKRTCERNEKRLTDVEMQINKAERYQRRWNLRLHGIPETMHENVKEKVLKICATVVEEPEMKLKDNIDIVHRLGRYDKEQKKPRATIIRFSNRTTRALIWRRAKGSAFLSENRLRFTEDLTAADRSSRQKLWPLIDAARKEGKKAHFAVYIGHTLTHTHNNLQQH